MQVKAIDSYDAESAWETLEVTMPMGKSLFDSFLQSIFEKSPHSFPILRKILEL